MRVYQLNTACGIRSTGRIAGAIADLLMQKGHSARIGHGILPVPDHYKNISYQIGGKWERKLHGALRKTLDGEGYGSFHATKKLVSDIKTFSPDIIHLHNIHGCYLHFYTLFNYLQKLSTPIVWTFHDAWPFTGHCAFFDMVQCEQWKNGCSVCPQQKSYPVNYGFSGVKRNYAMKKELFSSLQNLTIVTPSIWLKELVQLSFLNHTPVDVIMNGVNTQTFSPQCTSHALRSRYALGNKKIVLGVAADWDNRKGLPYLIQAHNALKSTHAFVAVGLSSSQIDTLPEGFLGIESTHNSEELASWYAIADCLANPTLEDNMPLVNLEALACGTPIAVFDTGGCAEVVNKHCGIVVPKGNGAAFIHAIKTITEDTSSWSQACRNEALRYDEQYTYEAYISLYEALLQ